MTTIAARVNDRASQYQKLSKELAREHEYNLELEGCTAERDRLTEQIRSKQVELGALIENSQKEFDDVRKLRHLSLRSAAATLTGKKREKTAIGQAKYQQAFDTEQQCKRKIEELQAELGIVTDKQTSLERQMDHIRQTREELNRLLDEIFDVSDPSYPLEPQLKSELDNYIQQSDTAARDAGRFKDAEYNLDQAKREMNKTIRALDSAINYVPFDLFGVSMMDEHQAACLELSKRHAWEAQRRMNIVRQVLPEVPHPETLDTVTNNMVLNNLQINMSYVDVAWKAKAQHTFALIATCRHNADKSLQWIRHYKQYAEGAQGRLQVAIESTRNALHNERRRIVDGILSGQPVDGFGGTSSSDYPDQPPPMYEAPPPDTNNAAAAPPTIPQDAMLSPPSPSNSTLSNNTPPSSSRPLSHPPPQVSPAQPPPPPLANGDHIPPATPPKYKSQNTHNPFRQ
ncbi:hypothetical protein O0I10_000497 [Lichtheimia ornata]|uniref:Uncharacterized protein n=1 Tax=Lichtheimia ornata TaxID=688661 RepID=A0AAD7Y3U9_9FUNG|nr:uncharacterized protein O0I10_000497 [Lichtheimia ornata]KAJ8663259.1 hypothetical protein O0I10_000497 [Lichtheimia ornata]